MISAMARLMVRLHLGVPHVSVVAHALGQVAGRDVEDVDIDFQDLVEVLDGDDVLDEDHRQDLVVGLMVVVVDAYALAARIRPARADRGELGGVQHHTGLVRGVDVWDDNGLCALVERAIDNARQIEIDAGDGCHAPQVCGPREVADVGKVHGPVLALDPYAVEAHRAEELDHVGRQLALHQERYLALIQLPFHPVRPEFSQWHTPLFSYRLKRPDYSHAPNHRSNEEAWRMPTEGCTLSP